MEKIVYSLLVLYCVFGFCAHGEVVSYLSVNRSLQIPSFDHDVLRHKGLFTVDIPLGGDGRIGGYPFYFTKLKIGSPPRDYYLFVDTGSYLTWLRCEHETLYNPKLSGTAKVVGCDHDLCITSRNHGCMSGRRCDFKMSYGDGSFSGGYLVNDLVQVNAVSGGYTTSPVSSDIVFGCSIRESRNAEHLGTRIDGLLGLGPSTLSFVTQLTASVPIAKTFAHCFDSENGGGIFVLGKVDAVNVKTTRLIPNRDHYRINMEGILVGNKLLQVRDGGVHAVETVVDTGTTLTYIPEEIYESLLYEIMSHHPDLKVYRDRENSYCFVYNGSVDAIFPVITLHFEDSLQLVVFPHDYLYTIQVDTYCVGWRASGDLSRSFQDIAILGDMVLSNKFFVYDTENQVIGWTEYDCSSPFGVQDGQVGPHHLYAHVHIRSAAHSHDREFVMILLVVLLFSLLFLQHEIMRSDAGIR